MTIKEALQGAVQELKNNEVSEPNSSAEVLLFNVLKKDRSFLYSHGDEKLTKEQEKKFSEFVKRRKNHEPVWYILGQVEFYGRKFTINSSVLTPRPETELLIEEVLKEVDPESIIIELGTGSGAIAITLSKELNRKIIATDISPEALEVAKENAKKLGVQVQFLEGDLLDPLSTDYLLPSTVLVANLPYIPSEDMDSLQFDVLHHEPRVALEGGEKGIVIYERLIDQLEKIDYKGKAFFEIGIEQGELLNDYIKRTLPDAKFEVKGDLAGIDRIVKIRF